ncbi:20258_t:CDS:2, partial [Racocetra persica]
AESNVLVDKSLLIKAVLESPAQVLLITRPRRWGKSLNLNMLKTFFEVTVDKSGNPLTREQSLKYKIFAGGLVDGVIRKAYKDHPYLAKSQQLDPVDKQLFNDYLRYEELSSDQIKN